MGRLLVALGVTAAIGLVGSAQANADSTDDAFLASLRQANITYGKPDQAVAAGRSVCEMVASGKKAADVVNALKDANPKFTLDGATRFVGIAANAYCPDQLSPGGKGGGT
ncbi:MAG: DUF732 domain-containing protein [Mycobacterium sp.]|uniref:DUF732 domain-containing protein n=1 Tax=Mycobacterium sp. TaxID=1785 RepID=UPI003CC63CB8